MLFLFPAITYTLQERAITGLLGRVRAAGGGGGVRGGRGRASAAAALRGKARRLPACQCRDGIVVFFTLIVFNHIPLILWL